jgi:hypothetical protein
MTPPQNRLKILLTPHHPTCENFCLKLVLWYINRDTMLVPVIFLVSVFTRYSWLYEKDIYHTNPNSYVDSTTREALIF